MNKGIILVVILLIIAYITNPTIEDFSDYISSETIGTSTSKTSDSSISGLGEMLVRELAEKLYRRDDYLVFSTYKGNMEIFSSSKDDIYLGIFKFFIKIQ